MRWHLALLTLVFSTSPAAAEPLYAQRWFYASHNLLVDQNADTLIGLIERAGKAGYNGVVLADYKFNILGRMPERYFKNVARVQEAARRHGIEIIPCLFPIGYSAGLLAHDANLAEGLPVRAVPFVVKGKEAVLASATGVVNGGFEEAKGDRFAGFAFQDGLGQSTFADAKVFHAGQRSCRMENPTKGNPTGNCRVSQRVKTRPFACYRLSSWIKTQDLKMDGEFRLLALGQGGKVLSYFDQQPKPTQDWTLVDVVFNSLEESEITVYAGQWGGKSGTLWLDDFQLEELPLVNVLRREGCPLTVTSADGQTTYEEGKDFQPIRDANLGQKPNPGDFSFRHAGARILLTDNSRIGDGDQLRISWYHPLLTHEYQVMSCLTEPKVYELLKDQAKRVTTLFEPRTVFMQHDEIRVAGWCDRCQRAKQTPGQLLAANVGRCVDILKEVNPKARVLVWSDMFDPHHNAVGKYYLVNGTLADSWQGLPKEVAIANWNGGKAAASLKWFAERGHQQVIAGYYDGDLGNFKKWHAAAQGVTGVTGFLYTTWQNKYDHLEAYGQALQGK